ncbi:MAG: Hsp20/alpha crystallin family protein [Gammaproteobacteria bacterium]|nr:Hsp20/alpha crystallin family protein [Gammaproteobacteria bacterium]
MKIATYRRPTSLFEQLHKEMGGLFERQPATANFDTEKWAPAVDIKETDTAYEIHADLPGVKPDDIEITLENGELSIQGSRQSSSEETQDDYQRIERFSGSFLRRFTLPDLADGENVSARTNEGVLELVIPKMEKAKQRKITVQSNAA